MNKSILEIAKQYYEGWETSNRELLHLSPSLKFSSPHNSFTSAQDFLDKCWQYSGAKFQNKVFLSGGSNVCVKYDFPMPGGGSKTIVEWLTIEGGEITKIEVFYEKE